MNERPLIIDGLQYCNWSEKIFQQMHDGGVSAVHATICYHENFRETVANIEQWNHWFEQYPKLIVHAKTAEDVRRAHAHGLTAIVFGLQNCSPIDDDYGLIEIMHTLGVRFKLSFFGATKFDPKSDKWTRINMYQGAPLPDEIGEPDSDRWMLLPQAPRTGAEA